MKAILAFDDFVLNRSDNTRRVFKKPDWRFDLAYTDSANPRNIWPFSVVPAPEGGYMMLYGGVPFEEPISDANMAIFMAHSQDGLKFEPYPVHPEAGIPHMRGRSSDEAGVYAYYDAEETDPALRYKAVHVRYGYLNGKMVEEPGYLLGSPDLIHWKRVTDALVTPSLVDCYTYILKNPVTGRYQCTTRRRWGERRICLVESEDFSQWSFPRAIVHPRPDDAPLTHLYSMPQTYYAPGEIFIGLLWKQVMPFNRVMDGPVVTEYAYSYDGLMWNRTDASIFPERERGEYGGGSVYGFAMIDRGEDIVFYANACRAEHGGIPGDWQKGMPPQAVMVPGVLRKNRFVCIDSGKGKAELMTQWLKLKTPELRINANIPFGSLKAELCVHGEAVEGFGLDDFEPVSGDQISAPLRWKGDLQALVDSGQWVQLHIVFEQAEVYAIEGDFAFNINTRAPAYDFL